jgi:hypothetical protein
MKKITLLFILCLTFASWSYAQCTNPVYQYPTTTVTITTDPGLQTIASNNWSQSEYSVLDGLVIGNDYTVTTDISTYITVTTDGTAIINSGLDSVSFTATTTGITIYWTLDAACANGPNTDIFTQIECTTCSCTAILPDAAVATLPLDGAVNVPIDVSDPAAPTIDFTWSDNGAAAEYNFTLVGVGSLSVNNPLILEYTYAYDTVYEWNVQSVNCAGDITSSNFTFTTESDPVLSTEEFNTKSFSVFPNPTADVLNIQTNETVNSIAIYNLLGKQVMFLKQNNISNNSVNVSAVTKGVYFVIIEANGKKERIKFIKK